MNSLAKGTNSFLQGTTTLGNSAINNVSDLISNSTSTIGNSVMKAANSVSNMTNNIGKNVNSGIESMNDTFRNVVESTTTVLEKVPVLNSLITGSNGNTGSNKNANNSSNGSNKNATPASSSGWLFGAGVFILLVCIFLFIFSMFNTQITIGINNIIATVRRAFGQSSPPLPPIADEAPVLPSAIPNGTDADKPSDVVSSSIINKLLPTGRKEVFNVSENEYSYYDAEPLCRALGAELATYSQVKEAWEKGADWCNYGWVKGQAAVYPTQSETWDKLQHGPADEKYACGNPGVNGGYFDNPEMRFGVTCYGQKPDQSSNDENMIMSRGGFPKTPSTLKVDKQIQEYKDSLDTIGILPFNSGAWSN
jgi:hypothetical protein